MNDVPAALVTGSTSGIGWGIARRLAQAGYDITLNGFGDSASILAAASELSRESGRRVRYCDADITQAPAVDRMVEEAHAAFGRLDVLVNNAGVQFVSPIIEFPTESWRLVLETNLSGAFYATRAVLPKMMARRFGRIINVASVHGLVASLHKSAYVAAKHGLIGLTKATALEVAESGVTCNAICPGFVDTPLVEKQIGERMATTGASRQAVVEQELLVKHAIKEFVGIGEIAALVEFLCSPAARSITGASLPIDAGWTAT